MIGSILKHAHVGWLYFVQAFKMRLAYRADFFVECLAAMLEQASGLLMLTFLFNQIPEIGGWTKAEVFFIYGFSLLPRALFGAFSMNFYMFSDRYIVQGEMDRLLLRPVSTLFQMVVEGLRFDFLAELVLGIAVISFASAKLGLAWTFSAGILFAFLVLGAWMVLTGVFLSLTALSFWTQDRISILPPVYNLLNFAQYPLTIFHKIVAFGLTFIIPFGFVAFYPSSIFLSRTGYALYAYLTPLAGLACLGLGCVIWRMGLRRYAGAGS